MVTYIQTAPQHGLSVLHVEGCKKIHHKVARVSMQSFAGPWDAVCDTCIRHGDPGVWESDAVDQRAAWQKELDLLVDAATAGSDADAAELARQFLAQRDSRRTQSGRNRARSGREGQ